MVYEVTSSGLPVADGRWHAVTLEKSGGLLTLAVNTSVVGQASGLPTLIRTNSPLFIGGLPGEESWRLSLHTAVHGLTMQQLAFAILYNIVLFCPSQCCNNSSDARIIVLQF